MNVRRRILWSCVAASVMAFGSACSKSDADVAANEVILTDTPVALSSVWVDASLKDGKAEWHPFRDPGNKPPAVEKGVAAKGGAAAEEINPTKGKKIEGDIRAMLDAYNALIVEGKFDEAVDYWVEPQHDFVKKINATLSVAREAFNQFHVELTKRMPDALDRVTKAVAPVEESLEFRVKADSIQVKSDTEAEGFAARDPQQPTLLFKQIDEDWYLQMPDALIPMMEASVEQLAPAFTALKAALESGQPPEPILQQLEARSAAASGAAQPEGS